MRSEVKEHTIRKFKGINTAKKGPTYEAVGLPEDQMVSIENFNIGSNGFLEKRFGIQAHSTITSPNTPLALRVIGAQRITSISTTGYVYVTDNNRVWKVNASSGVATEVLITVGNPPVGNLQWAVEYGGTAASTAYYNTGIRWAPGITTAMGGVITLYPGTSQASDWVANTPVGTHMTVFKDRGWVINSQGSSTLTGDETKVWFSQPTSLGDYGGAGLPNNFNLDFGDGDYLVATIPYNDQLICFKTRKIFAVSVDGDPTSWQYRTLSDRVGCVGRGTVKLIDGKMYFLSLDGVVRTDGTQFELISEPITDLLETYRDFKLPATVMNTYASYWQNKYILWLPRELEVVYGDNALVFDIPTSTWTTWRLTNGVTSLGEAKFNDLHLDTLFFGSWSGNKLWKMDNSSYTDNGAIFPCSFTTKKMDFGEPMSRKRNFLMGLTVKDEAANQGTVTVATSSEDATAVSTVAVPSPSVVLNIKARGAGYGRYFQTTVTQQSTAYSAVYDLTWMTEERGIEPKSLPVKNV